MFDQILTWAVIIAPTLFAIGLEVVDEEIRKRSRTWRYGVIAFGVAISALTWFQMARADKTHSREQQDLKNELDQSLLNQQYTKGQLDSLSLMVGRLGEPTTNPQNAELTAVLKQMMQATAQNVSDLKAANGDLCKRAHAKAEEIRVFQEQYDASERSWEEQRWQRQVQAKSDQQRNDLFSEEINHHLNAWQTHDADFHNKYMADAKYLRDLLMDRIPPQAAGVLRNANNQADMNLTGSSLAGAFNEYGIADYLDALANTVCQQPEQERKSKQATYRAVANHLHQLRVEGEKLHQRCWPNSTNPPSDKEVADWINRANEYVHRSQIEESLKTQFEQQGPASNTNFIMVAPGCASLMGKVLDKSASLTALEGTLAARAR